MIIPLSVVARSIYSIRSSIQRYKDEAPIRRAQRSLLREAKEKERLERYAVEQKEAEQRRITKNEIRSAKNELEASIKRHHLDIDEVERTDALSFYTERGESLAQAYHNYRSQIESGTRFPTKRSDCVNSGRALRKALGCSTYEDRLHFQQVAKLDKIKEIEQSISANLRQMRLGFFIAVVLVFAAVGIAIAEEDTGPLVLILGSAFLILRCVWIKRCMSSLEQSLEKARKALN